MTQNEKDKKKDGGWLGPPENMPDDMVVFKSKEQLEEYFEIFNQPSQKKETKQGIKVASSLSNNTE